MPRLCLEKIVVRARTIHHRMIAVRAPNEKPVADIRNMTFVETQIRSLKTVGIVTNAQHLLCLCSISGN